MDAGVEKQRSCITHLPDDILYLIFKNLDSKRDQDSFGLICHQFFDIQNSNRKCLELKYSRISKCPSRAISEDTDFILKKLLNRFRELESLNLRHSFGLSDSDLIQLQKYGSKLHSLYLSSCSHVTDKGLTFVAYGCPLLSIINLSKCSISDSGLKILTKSCKSLKEVNLAWCSRITDRGILYLNQNCRQLRALDISSCHNIVGVSFQGCSPTLACLEANDCAFDPLGVTSILSGGGLEYLNLSSPHKRTRGHGLQEAIGLGFAANLKVLNLCLCFYIRDDDIIIISKGCPLLQEWNLSCCLKIEISGWQSIGLYCQNLETIHVNYCDNLCDRGLLALGNGCKRLSVVHLSNCKKITSYGIRHFMIQRMDVEIKENLGTTIFPNWAFT